MNKLKIILVAILLLVLSQIASANSTQSQFRENFKIIPGKPFLSRFVDITREELDIKINPEFESADFTIKYHISSAKEGLQIPLLFIDSDYALELKVFLDGVELILKPIPQRLETLQGTKFSNFMHVFGEGKSSDYSVNELEEVDFYVTLNDMLYFEANIAEGKHIIEVKYEAIPFISIEGYVKNYSFRYALSPAHYWQSFGLLDLSINGADFNRPLTINIEDAQQGNINGLGTWHFESMPTEVLKISYHPKISATAKFLMDVDMMKMPYVVGFLLLLINLLALYRSRLKNLQSRFTAPFIIGLLIVPLLIASAGFIYFFLLQITLGKDVAPMPNGPFYILLFVYPVTLPIYSLLLWVSDWFMLRILKNKKS